MSRRWAPLAGLLTAHTVSLTGNMLTLIALPLYVLAKTGSPAATGLAGAFATAPVVLGGAFGGVRVDRIGYRRASLLADLVSGVTVAAVKRNRGLIASAPPDQNSTGTLAIPTTVALVAGAPQPEPAKQLIDYLLSPEVERRLIDAEFAGWSVRAPAAELKTMDVDYAAAAKVLPEAVKTAMTILEGRE